MPTDAGTSEHDHQPLAPDSWVKIRTVAHRISVSERTVRQLIAEGRLRTSKIGPRCVRVHWASVLELLEQTGGAR